MLLCLSLDLVNVKATLDSQLSRCSENRNAWLELLSCSRRREINAGNIPTNVSSSSDNFDVSSSSSGQTASRSQPGTGDCNTHPMPTFTFNSIADSLLWISRGRDCRLANGLNIDCAYHGAEQVRTAKHVFVLCTGSLHLIGGILSLLDPVVCDK